MADGELQDLVATGCCGESVRVNRNGEGTQVNNRSVNRPDGAGATPEQVPGAGEGAAPAAHRPRERPGRAEPSPRWRDRRSPRPGATPYRAGTSPESSAPRRGPALRPQRRRSRTGPGRGGAEQPPSPADWTRRGGRAVRGSRRVCGARAGDGTGLGVGRVGVRGPGGSLLSPLAPPPSLLSRAPGAALEGPPGSRAAAPGLLECGRCRYLRTARGERGGRGRGTPRWLREPLPLSRWSGAPGQGEVPSWPDRWGPAVPARPHRRPSLQPAARWWKRCSPC